MVSLFFEASDVLGLIKVILIAWIAIVVVRWYRRLDAGKRNSGADTPQPAPRIDHAGRIEDAEFEDMDDNRRTSD